jgi:putative SOS response-associated peptidase YedK
MCGRYALGLRASQIREYLADEDLPSFDAPPDEGPGAPRRSFNFAPGYNGLVYRADVPDHGAGPLPSSVKHANDGEHEPEVGSTEPQPEHKNTAAVRYKLQTMQWGLVPFWTKRAPDFASKLKTINCRDDSLAQPTGMWNTIKPRKRCLVVCQGFYEWLKTANGRVKTPHFVKRRDGRLMGMAGLWDCARYEDGSERAKGEPLYTYTIITTDSNKQLRFLHDRMPCILGAAEARVWLDPGRCEWTRELQALLRPYEHELECYPVSSEVGKVGNNSERFIVPLDSAANKANIANFFARPSSKPKFVEPVVIGSESNAPMPADVWHEAEVERGQGLEAAKKFGVVKRELSEGGEPTDSEPKDNEPTDSEPIDGEDTKRDLGESFQPKHVGGADQDLDGITSTKRKHSDASETGPLDPTQKRRRSRGGRYSSATSNNGPDRQVKQEDAKEVRGELKITAFFGK